MNKDVQFALGGGVHFGAVSLNIFFSCSFYYNGVPFQKWPLVNRGALPSPYLLMEDLAISLEAKHAVICGGQGAGRMFLIRIPSPPLMGLVKRTCHCFFCHLQASLYWKIESW